MERALRLRVWGDILPGIASVANSRLTRPIFSASFSERVYIIRGWETDLGRSNGYRPTPSRPPASMDVYWNKLFGLPTVTSLHPFASSGLE